MKLTNLYEGTIQVPHQTVEDIMNLLCHTLLSKITTYLVDYTEADEDGDSYGLLEAYKKIHHSCQKKYGRISVVEMPMDQKTEAKVYMRGSEINPRYLKRNKSAANKTFTLQIYALMSKTQHIHAAFSIEDLTMYSFLPHEEYLKRVAKNPELFEGMLVDIEGTVEHELQHGIQTVALKSAKTPTYYKVDGDIDDDGYFSSDMEYSPLIVSELASMRAFIINHNIRSEQVPDLIKSWVDPTHKSQYFTGASSDFFSWLHKNDKTKWKRAVKYFYSLFLAKHQ